MKRLFILSLLLNFTFSAPTNLTSCQSTSPTIVFVPGAFTIDSGMDVISAQLQQAGYGTRIRSLSSVNGPGLTVLDDTSDLRRSLLVPLIEEQGKEIVLYLHSYAGFPGSAAIAGLSKRERTANGQLGGIVGLIYQSALIPHEDDTLLKTTGGKYAPWQTVNNRTGLVSLINPQNILFPDVPEPLACAAVQSLYGQSIASFESQVGPVYYGEPAYDGRRVYLHTNLDRALPPVSQDLFVADSGTTWEVRRLNTSHSPFLSQPATLAILIQDLIQGFERTLP